MEIDVTQLSDQDLAQLIASAMQEWAGRQTAPEQQAVIQRKPASEPRVVTITEPPQDMKDFVLRIKAMVSKGALITPGERKRVVKIAEDYPDWVTRQGLPTVNDTRAWHQASEQMYRHMPTEL